MVQLRTQSLLINGVNGCDQSKAGTGGWEAGGDGRLEVGSLTAKSKEGERIGGEDKK